MRVQVKGVVRERCLEDTHDRVGLTTDVSLWQLLFVFLRLGTISFGGKPSPLLFDELVSRRSWVTKEYFAEVYTMAKLLPGPTGQITAIFLLQQWRSNAVTLLCMVMYMAPGMVMMFSLALLFLETKQPAWVQGGIAGLALAATALLLTMAFNMVSSALRAHLGLVISAAAFLGTCILGVDLLLTLLILIPLATVLNRPSEATTYD